MRLVTSDQMTVDTVGDDSSWSDAEKNSLIFELSAGRWVVGCFSKYNTETEKIENHAIVINGYDAINDVYSCWDPWTDEEGITLSSDKLFEGNRVLPWSDSVSGDELCYFISFVYCR